MSEIRITHHGKWLIDEGIEIDCYVTEDKRRLLSLRGTARAIDLKGAGSTGLARFLESNYLQPFMSDSLKAWVAEIKAGTIQKIKGQRGKDFIPFEADLFIDVCKSVIAAKDAGVFSGSSWDRQREYADRLQKITFAFAKTGLVALIDEITGFQYERERDDLQKILAQYVREEFLPWTKRFPDEFYKEMFRLKGWTYNGNPKPQYAGKLTNYLVYDRLPDGVLDELQKKNPKNESGNRVYRHHQFLTDHTGVTHLDRHLASVITLMKISKNWEVFEEHFKTAFGIPHQATMVL